MVLVSPPSHHLQNALFFLSTWWKGSVSELLPGAFCKLSWNYKGEDAATGKKDGSARTDSETAPGTQRFVTDGGWKKSEWRTASKACFGGMVGPSTP